MDDKKLEEIEARADAATPGPWRVWDRGVGYHIALGELTTFSGRPERLLPEGFRTDIGLVSDAEFIAAAREDVPALIALVREQQKDIQRLRAELEERRADLGEALSVPTLGDARAEIGGLRAELADRDQRAAVYRRQDDERHAAIVAERDALKAQLETECVVSYGWRDERDELADRVAELEQDAARLREALAATEGLVDGGDL